MPIEIKPIPCGAIQENAYIVSLPGRDDCVIIDPGDEAPALARAIGDRRLAAILLTHGHFDHIMAVGELAQATGAPVYIRAEDMEMLDDMRLNGGAELMVLSAMPGPAIHAQPLGDAVAAAGMAFRALHTPGHSKGSACFYLPDEGALFSGDTLFLAGFGRTDLHGGSQMQMRDSLRALFQLPPETRVYPGHGGETTIGAERSRYRL